MEQINNMQKTNSAEQNIQLLVGMFLAQLGQNPDSNPKELAAMTVESFWADPEGFKTAASNLTQDDIKNGLNVLPEQDREQITNSIESAEAYFKEAVQLSQESQVQAARRGAKLGYLKSLKGHCPEGFEITYMMAGGTPCPICKKVKAKNVETKEKVKMEKGGVSKTMNGIKNELKKGGCMKKVKKHEEGGTTKENKKPAPKLPEPKTLSDSALIHKRDSVANKYLGPNKIAPSIVSEWLKKANREASKRGFE